MGAPPPPPHPTWDLHTKTTQLIAVLQTTMLSSFQQALMYIYMLG